MNLLEAYSKRLAVSDEVYSNQHFGAKMNQQKKIVVAQCLKNIESFMNKSMRESFAPGAATQGTNMGAFKKFCLNLTTVTVPSLIANDLVYVYPMTSLTGYVAYVKYSYSTSKGQVTAPQTINSPFGFGNYDESYSSDRVVETFATAQTALAWTPVQQGVFKDADGNVLGDVKITADGTIYYGTFADAASAKTGTLASMTFKTAAGSSTSYTIKNGDKIAYVYDNILIPQNNLPTISATIEGIDLHAHARRIAVYYSQIAAFQAETDYGLPLGDQLAEQAMGALAYKLFVA